MLKKLPESTDKVLGYEASGKITHGVAQQRYRNNFTRYAVVSDSPVFEWTSKVADAISSGEVRRFDSAEYDEAWRWVQQPAGND